MLIVYELDLLAPSKLRKPSLTVTRYVVAGFSGVVGER